MSFWKKAEKFLFYFLIFAVPFGTRKVLYEWPQPASPAGNFFNEWESVSFYFTDGLLLLLVLLWMINGGLIRLKSRPLGIFLVLAGVSVLAAQNPVLGVYHWLRLAEMAVFFIYIRDRLGHSDLKKVLGVFIFSALLQSFVAIGQSMMQRSLGLKVLGESVLNPAMINVAKFVSQGTNILRAYGTLPHPNVLAAFLSAAVFFLLYLYFKGVFRGGIFVFVPAYFILLFGLFLTFSRGITLLFIFVLACWFAWLLFKRKREFGLKIFYAALILVAVYGLLSAVFYRQAVAERYQISAREEAVSFRLFYTEVAARMINQNPVLGVGMGNFVLRMGDFLDRPLKVWDYQPVHNIFLLIAAELGLAAMAVFVWFLVSVVRPVLRPLGDRLLLNSLFLSLFAAFVFFGLFDHFFWTLQPGKLTLWLVLGLIAAKK